MMIDVALLVASIACQMQDVVIYYVLDTYDQKTDLNFAKSATSAGKYTPLALAFPHVCLSNHYFIHNQYPAIAIERTECTNLAFAGGFDSFECSDTCKLRLCK
jgi:hypothetical protein